MKTQLCKKKETTVNHSYFVIDYSKYDDRAPSCEDLGGKPVTNESECFNETNKHLLGCTGGIDPMPYKDFTGKNGFYTTQKPWDGEQDCAKFAMDNGKNIFKKDTQTYGKVRVFCNLYDDHPGQGKYLNGEDMCGYSTDDKCKSLSKDYSDDSTRSYYWGNNCRVRNVDNVCTMKMQNSFNGGSDASWRQTPHSGNGKFRAELCKMNVEE